MESVQMRSCWRRWPESSVTGVLVRGEIWTQTHLRGEDQVKMKAEIG